MLHTVRDTFLEIKEIAFGNHSIDMEGYALELANRSLLSVDDVKNAYNNLVLIKLSLDNPTLSYSKKRVWEKCEDDLMSAYMELSMKELNGNKTKSTAVALKELVGIIPDRTESSIPFRYYHMNDTKKTKAKPKMKALPITNPSSKPEPEPSKKSNKDDLLDTVIDIVDNVDTAGVNVESLFEGILQLSRKAVQNSNVDKLEALEGQVSFLESELDKERNKNEMLQSEMSRLISDFEKLKQEIEYFDGLSGKQKLKQLHNFNNNMKYMIDKFGGVIAVGL